jgi:tRNA A-37 threonylcarbamoyl transferase component Bud32
MVSDTTRIGTTIAGYRIESLLGRGGMSVVYLAEHMRLGRKVALKVLAPALARDDAFRERFIYESQRAAELDHPNVISIYDAGEVEGGDADGLLYIAMRYVRGADLRSILQEEGPLSVGRTLFMLEQVASALDAAHDRDLIHRDVKPSNILVAQPSDHVYLTDFGIVKHTTSRGLTRTGIFVGTADYAAPEQIEGRPLDGRTDVYALGCVLYECLTGKPPFDREAEVAVMHAHLTEPPPALTGARPDLPAALDRIVMTAMAKLKEERFATGPQLVEAARAAVLQRHPTERREPIPSVSEPQPPASEVVEAPPRPVPAAAEPPPAAGIAPAAEPPGGRPEVPSAPTGRRRRQWVVYALIALAAAALSAGVVLIATSGDDDSDSPSRAGAGTELPAAEDLRLQDLVPSQIWKACAVQNTPSPGAIESAVCLPAQTDSPGRVPDRLELSLYPNASTVNAAYRAELDRSGVKSGGRCDGANWGGEGEWFHPVAPGAPTKPGGDRFCFFNGDDAVIVWTHRRLAQATHQEMLAGAREGALNHAGLFSWWRFWRHNIGKTR